MRKILQSQKTFANHLSDAEALAALAPPTQSHAQSTTTATTTAAAAAAPAASTPAPQPPAKRAYKRRSTVALAAEAAPVKAEKTEQQDTPMTDADTSGSAPFLATGARFAPHPGDADPLLRSRVPPMPTREEVERLFAAPALGYLEARAALEEGAAVGSRRRFCEVCGYWGRVRCVACGTRCCALECLGVHREECFGGAYGG